MNKTPIYAVTTIRGSLDAGCRCVGYFHEFEIAKDALVNNELDINEMGYYPFAVIEELKPGFYSYPRNEYWFKWNPETEKYEEYLKPERFKQYCGWGMG
jgi:hypothetical protein